VGVFDVDHDEIGARVVADVGEAGARELLDILTLPDFERAGAIQSNRGKPKTRTFGELLNHRPVRCALRPSGRATPTFGADVARDAPAEAYSLSAVTRALRAVTMRRNIPLDGS
jgi:hypothetical protein